MRRALCVVAAAAAFNPFLASAEDGAFPHGVLAAHGGRYVFGQVSPYAKHQYLLDTQTGRMWQLVCARQSDDGKSCAFNALDPLPFLQQEPKLAYTPAEAGAAIKLGK